MRYLMLVGEFALRALLLGGAGFLVTWILRRSGAETQHAIWRVVLFGMLALPFLTAILPVQPLLPIRTIPTAPAKTLPAPTGAAHLSITSAPIASLQASPSHVPWQMALVGVYGIVAIFFLLRTLLLLRRATNLASSAARIVGAEPDLRESEQVTIPFTVGWRKAVIVLPNNWRDWDEFKLRSVLTHERTHIRRADWTTAVAASINRAVFWFHPLAWWLERQLATLAEEACDAAAIRSTGDAPRYASVVLEFAEVAARQPLFLMTAMARTSRVGRRINGILEGRGAPPKAVTGIAAAVILALAMPLIYLAATLQFGAVAAAPGAPYYRNRIADHQALLGEGWHLTPAEAEKLESQLAADPENLALRSVLLSYYTQYMIPEPRTAHILWLIEHHPEAEVFRFGSEITNTQQGYTKLNSAADAERARVTWLNQVERFPTDTRVLANAALALGNVAPGTALDLVKRARTQSPSDPEWVNWLGVNYARAVRVVFAGGWDHIHSFTTPSHDRDGWNAFALIPLPDCESLKNELESSPDADLVGATGEALVIETSTLNRSGTGFVQQEVSASASFGKRLLARAHELAPANPRWQAQEVR